MKRGGLVTSGKGRGVGSVVHAGRGVGRQRWDMVTR